MCKFHWHIPFLLGGLALFCLFMQGCDEIAPTQAPLNTVTYTKLQAKTVLLTSELSGRTSAFMVSEVRPQVNGIIQDRLFVEGSDVKKGDVLYQIDPSLYQAAYDNAKATLEKAEANAVAAKLLAERYQQVVKVNAVSKQEYDNAVAAYGQAQAEVSAAKAALDTARINLDYTKVTAPVSGRIGRSTVTPGALVTQNQADALATVQQLDPMYVDVTQSSTELLRLKRAFESGALTRSSGEEAMQVTLKLEDGTTYVHRVPKTDPVTGENLKHADGAEETELAPVIGALKFSEVTVEQSTGVVTIRAIFPNPDGTLLPGMYVRAILEEGVNEKAILIPQKAVIRNNRGLPVARVLTKSAEPGSGDDVFDVESRVIAVDRSIGNDWLVTDGLKEGELLLIEGLQKAQTGRPVRGVRDTAGHAGGASAGTPSQITHGEAREGASAPAGAAQSE